MEGKRYGRDALEPTPHRVVIKLHEKEMAERREAERAIAERGGLANWTEARPPTDTRETLSRNAEIQTARVEAEDEANRREREDKTLAKRVDKIEYDARRKQTDERGKRKEMISDEARDTKGIKGVIMRWKEGRIIDKRNSTLDFAIENGLRPSNIGSPKEATKLLKEYGSVNGRGYRSIAKRDGLDVANKNLRRANKIDIFQRLSMFLHGDFNQPDAQSDLIHQWRVDRSNLYDYWRNRKNGLGDKISDKDAMKAIKRLKSRRMLTTFNGLVDSSE